jgi:hypothetical protein
MLPDMQNFSQQGTSEAGTNSPDMHEESNTDEFPPPETLAENAPPAHELSDDEDLPYEQVL